MNSVNEVLDFAIEREAQAAAFYETLAARAEAKHMRQIFLDFAAEELRHQRRLEAVKQGEQNLSAKQQVIDIKLSDYLVDVEVTDHLSYQDALIVVMKREQLAFKLYATMAAEAADPQLHDLFEGLAKEEAKHKLYFESEYDERILRDN